MNIEDKLALSGRSGVISFIREGMFYRCYQQSLFFYLTQCDGNIKILGKRIKKLNGEAVFYGGFPITQLERRYPEAELTEWGRRLKVNGLIGITARGMTKASIRCYRK